MEELCVGPVLCQCAGSLTMTRLDWPISFLPAGAYQYILLGTDWLISLMLNKQSTWFKIAVHFTATATSSKQMQKYIYKYNSLWYFFAQLPSLGLVPLGIKLGVDRLWDMSLSASWRHRVILPWKKTVIYCLYRPRKFWLRVGYFSKFRAWAHLDC